MNIWLNIWRIREDTELGIKFSFRILFSYFVVVTNISSTFLSLLKKAYVKLPSL